ncbi:MAG TPA: hypothetical protein DCS43_09955 [Verrucomicrobia bacterium]|nr:hypothetical protein [Verrucomicrobiota bacterium]
MQFNRLCQTVCCLLLVVTGVVDAQGQVAPARDTSFALSNENSPIEANADGALEYDKINGRITATSNVVITCGRDILYADRVLVETHSGDAYALGNVVLKRGGEEIRAAKLHYNFRTRVSNLDNPSVDSDPFHVQADTITRTDDNQYEIHNAKVTTCVYPHPHSHYHVRAHNITLVPNQYMKSWHAVWYLGSVPCFYLPYWKVRLDEPSAWRFYPGYRSRWGAYLLTSYRQRLSPQLRSEHHVDYRTERGFAIGEDLRWNVEQGNGDLSLYFLDDQEPYADDRAMDAEDVESQRYRLRLRHAHGLDERTRLLTQANYLSDATVLSDFYEREYRQSRQPENYVSVSHRRDAFTLTVLANARLNDFYSNVNRLPEVSLNVFRLQLGDSSVYYESQTAAANLERVWPEDGTNTEYSAFRVDTSHMVYQPRRLDGWLNVIPRAGYRGTYYSESIDLMLINTQIVQQASGALLRNAFEVGSEVSYKALKLLVAGDDGLAPWRHVVEPYADYSLRFEPNALPEDLYQFDSVDTLDELHQLRVGVRNKFQTKRDGSTVDAADVDLYTKLRLNPEGEKEFFDLVSLDSEFHPATWIQLDVDGDYSTQDSVLQRLNTRFTIEQEKFWEVGVEHRYRDKESNLLAADVTIYPNLEWAFNLFGRYEFEGSRVEEQGGYVQRNLDCLSIRMGGSVLPGYTRTDGSERDDDYRVLLEIWLTAFPEMGIGSNQR